MAATWKGTDEGSRLSALEKWQLMLISAATTSPGRQSYMPSASVSVPPLSAPSPCARGPATSATRPPGEVSISQEHEVEHLSGGHLLVDGEDIVLNQLRLRGEYEPGAFRRRRGSIISIG
jgi:hypothetical protein